MSDACSYNPIFVCFRGMSIPFAEFPLRSVLLLLGDPSDKELGNKLRNLRTGPVGRRRQREDWAACMGDTLSLQACSDWFPTNRRPLQRSRTVLLG